TSRRCLCSVHFHRRDFVERQTETIAMAVAGDHLLSQRGRMHNGGSFSEMGFSVWLDRQISLLFFEGYSVRTSGRDNTAASLNQWIGFAQEVFNVGDFIIRPRSHHKFGRRD